MNKWLMLVALVLMTLASAVGLRNLQANQAATATPIVASTGNPVPVMPPPTKGGGTALFASTGNPVPVMPPPTKGGGTALLASTGNPVPVMPPPTKGGGSALMPSGRSGL